MFIVLFTSFPRPALPAARFYFTSLPNRARRSCVPSIPAPPTSSPFYFLLAGLLPVHFAIVMEFEAFIRTENKLA